MIGANHLAKSEHASRLNLDEQARASLRPGRGDAGEGGEELIASEWSEHVPFLTAGEHRILAAALRAAEDQVIVPDDEVATRIAFDHLHEAGWLDHRASDGDVWDANGNLRTELGLPDEIVVGYLASVKLRETPWAQTLIDNPFPD